MDPTLSTDWIDDSVLHSRIAQTATVPALVTTPDNLDDTPDSTTTYGLATYAAPPVSLSNLDNRAAG